METNELFEKIMTKLQARGYTLAEPLSIKHLDESSACDIVNIETGQLAKTQMDYDIVSAVLNEIFDSNYVAHDGWNILPIKKQETFRLATIVLRHSMIKKNNVIRHIIKVDQI